MRKSRLALILLVTLATCGGCRTLGEAFLRGLFDSAYSSQYEDGRASGGLTRAEKRARFEESSIRQSLSPWSYGEEGRVPGI